MNSIAPRTNVPNVVVCTVLGVGFSILYVLATQRNLTYDGAAFLATFGRSPLPAHLHHPLFSYSFWGAIQIGIRLGLSEGQAGHLYAALFGGLSVACFQLLLPRFRVSIGCSAIYSALLGLSMTVLENATTVELYTPSLFSLILSLHAFRSITDEPTRRSCLLMWLANMLVVGFHIGYAPWVFALYMSAALRRRDWKTFTLWILQGVAVLAGLILWLYLEGGFGERSLGEHQDFLGTFSRFQTDPTSLVILFESPLMFIGRFAGLILFPAALGVTVFRREAPMEFRAGCIVLVISWILYSFWACDFGSFFLPVLLIWGVGAAITMELAMTRLGSRGFAFMISALAVYAWLFLILPTAERFPDVNETLLRMLQLAYWLVTIGMAVCSRWFCSLLYASSPRATHLTHRFQAILGAVAIILLLLAYAPRLVRLKKPYFQTLVFEQLMEIAPAGSRIATHISPYTPEALTGFETLCGTKGGGIHNGSNWNTLEDYRAVLTRWLRELAMNPDRRVFLDHEIYHRRHIFFGDETTGSRVEIELDRLEFKQIPLRVYGFYEVQWKEQAGRRVVELESDLNPAED